MTEKHDAKMHTPLPSRCAGYGADAYGMLRRASFMALPVSECVVLAEKGGGVYRPEDVGRMGLEGTEGRAVGSISAASKEGRSIRTTGKHCRRKRDTDIGSASRSSMLKD